MMNFGSRVSPLLIACERRLIFGNSSAFEGYTISFAFAISLSLAGKTCISVAVATSPLIQLFTEIYKGENSCYILGTSCSSSKFNQGTS